MATRQSGSTHSAKILPFTPSSSRIRCISPAYEGHCLLYSHHALSRDKLYAIRILRWARLADGRDVAVVPWLNDISHCRDLNDAETGLAVGYYDPACDDRFDTLPSQHRAALDALSEQVAMDKAHGILQEIPDLIGSHAAMVKDSDELVLEPVVSWQLRGDGRMQAMLADPERITQQPVLPGDPCLYAADHESGLRYYFQYHIANQIKNGGAMSTRILGQLIRR